MDHSKSYIVDFKEIFSVLIEKKIVIFVSTLIAAILSLLLVLIIPNTYTSKALLSPNNQSESMSSILSSYSTIAGMAGLNLPSEAGTKSSEAIERLKSLDFFVNYFLPNIELQDLFAVKKWDQYQNILTYDSDIYDQASNKWVRDVKFPQKIIPSDQESFEEYLEIINISEDKNTGFISLSVSHKSPYVAKQWLDIIILNINESMREVDKKMSEDAILFLNKRAETTRLTELKEAIATLLESQMQTLMMASIGEGYVFKVISSPAVPELRSSPPSRAILCILGTILGFIVGLLIVIVRFYFFDSKKSLND